MLQTESSLTCARYWHVTPSSLVNLTDFSDARSTSVCKPSSQKDAIYEQRVRKVGKVVSYYTASHPSAVRDMQYT
jgi:hypothetical protein